MSEKVKVISEFDFDKIIKEESKPILIDFFAKWCSPCRMQAPILDELANELSDKISVYKVDIDECESLAIKYGVQSMT